MPRRLWLAPLIGLFWPALTGWTPSLAQITTGGIEGVIVDGAGKTLPGVRVAARCPDTGFEQIVGTDGTGRYMILGLPPAGYRVQPTLPGYGAAPRNVIINVGQTVPLDFTMQPVSGLVETVTVTTAIPILNTTKPELSTVVSEEKIREYPLLNRDFTDLALLAPGVRKAPESSFVTNGFTTGGTLGRNLNISIDGADNNDAINGGYLQRFPLDAIEEFEIIQDQPRAEYGRSSGAVVNVLTRSGTNDFSGSVFGTFRNEDTRSSSFGERMAGSAKQSSDRTQFGFALGGPIVKDKLFYFAAVERQSEETPVGLSPLLTVFAGSEPPGFPFVIASPGSGYVQSLDRDLATVKITWNASPGHQAWLRYAGEQEDFANALGSPLSDPSNSGATSGDWRSVVGSWQWVIGGNMINEMKIHHNHFDGVLAGTSPDPNLTLLFDSFALGQNFLAPQGHMQRKAQLRDDFSWISGRNSFKAGIEVTRIRQEETFGTDGPIVDIFFNGGIVPGDTMVSGDAGATNGTAANGVDDGIDVIAAVAITSPFRGPGSHEQYGAYFQDTWDVSDRWQVYLGLRVDAEPGLWDAERGANEAFYKCLADPADNSKCGRDPATVNPPAGIGGFSRTFPRDPVNVSPRLAFVHRLGGEATDVLRGSWGLFYDQVVGNIPLFGWGNNCPDCFPALPVLFGCDPADLSNCSTTTQLRAGTVVHPGAPPLPSDFTLYNWVNDPGLRNWANNFFSSLGPATFNDTIPGLVSPDWKAPYTSAFSLGWGHAFSPSLALDTNLVYRRGFHQMRIDSYAGRTSGREAPWPATTDPATGIATYYGALNLLTTNGKYEYLSLQFALSGRYARLDFGANLNLSEARGTQDNAALGGVEGAGVFDIFEGGNIQFTGGSIDSEWGRISGDQALYALLHGTYRFPHSFKVSAEAVYGTRVSVHGYSGEDLNGDGFGFYGFPNNGEYGGARGDGKGDDLFYLNCRMSKVFDTGRGTALEGFLDVFNVTNQDNSGTLVIHRQFVSSGGSINANPDYLQPTGATVTPPRTFQLGIRFAF